MSEQQQQQQRRTVDAGDWDGLQIVSSGNGTPLECFGCGDKSLYHDSVGYWNAAKDDLLCGKCYRKQLAAESNCTYVKVLTFH